MHRFTVVSLFLLTILAVSAVVSSTALALPVLLNSEKKELPAALPYTGTSGALTFVKLNGKELTCKKSTSTGEFAAKSVLGPFHTNIVECSGPLGSTCTGAGDAAGAVLVLGEAHLVYDNLTPTLGAAVLFLIPQFHFTCTAAGINVLLLIKGELLCLITPLTLATVFTISCKQVAGKPGDPEETSYWTDAGTEVKLPNGFLMSESTSSTEEKFEMSAQEGGGSITTTKAVEIMD